MKNAHAFPSPGPGHECSYVDCWCDHLECKHCGVEDGTPEAEEPCRFKKEVIGYRVKDAGGKYVRAFSILTASRMVKEHRVESSSEKGEPISKAQAQKILATWIGRGFDGHLVKVTRAV